MPAHTCNRRSELDKPITTLVQDGWVLGNIDGYRTRIPHMVEHRTQWLPIVCGHDKRATDPDCQHCPRAKPAPAPSPEKCEWRLGRLGEYWKSACGVTWLDHFNPQYCPGCGNLIEAWPYKEGE